ncbi:MAG TPA: hypothetical protein VMA72_06525 [Streptosporangiaceae bacterium]|nr:hypothetical protein [Streptosporangiaceae bacterium]
MAEIVIRLERGPDDQPVGEVRRASGRRAGFTGWLALIRILEDELDALPPHNTAFGTLGDEQRPSP